jgi:hypothetical protein
MAALPAPAQTRARAAVWAGLGLTESSRLGRQLEAAAQHHLRKFYFSRWQEYCCQQQPNGANEYAYAATA